MNHEGVIEQGHGISAVDTGLLRPMFDASHLIVRDGEAAFVDCGTAHSVPALLAALGALGLRTDQVRYLLLTHIHLDHAGGAGQLMAALPAAICIAHPRAVRHLIDPAKLEAGTRAVYGDETYDRVYGALQPIPAERVREVADGERLSLGSSELEFLHTEGHAKHHYCIWDSASRRMFTGDTFGLSYRAFDTDAGPFIFPTTTPVHFDPEAARGSIDRIVSYQPEACLLTHYSSVRDVPRLAGILKRELDAYVAIVEAVDGEEAAIASRLRAHLEARLDGHGVADDPELRETWLAGDVALNAQGLAYWYATR
jgi:glyoxylase-like metal-dependent hydrolase (beta-lactamase superfamily II)